MLLIEVSFVCEVRFSHIEKEFNSVQKVCDILRFCGVEVVCKVWDIGVRSLVFCYVCEEIKLNSASKVCEWWKLQSVFRLYRFLTRYKSLKE